MSLLTVQPSRIAAERVDLLTGLAMFVYWIVVSPPTEISPTQSQWPYVLWFGATILMLAFAASLFGTMVGGNWVVKLAWLSGVTVAVASAANIIEDGFDQEWAFLLFAIGTGGILAPLTSGGP